MKNAEKREVAMASLSPLMEEILSRGGAVEITVTGNSMWPMLCDRRSLVRLTAADKLAVGDIPLYRRDNGVFTLHRIVGEKNGTFVCCGDNQTRLEEGVRRDQMLACVTAFSRNGVSWHSCKKLSYRVYRRLWMWILPMRPAVSSLAVNLVRLFRK